MICALFTALRRYKQALEARKNERRYDKAYRKRCDEGAYWIGLAFVALLSLPASGCHHQAPARTALNAAAEALHAVDTSVTIAYVARSEAALEASPNLEAYRERMAPLDRAHDAIVAAAAALLSAQAVLDGSDSRSFGHGFRCTLDALQIVQAALVEIGLEVPPEVGQALAFLSAVAVGDCPLEPRP